MKGTNYREGTTSSPFHFIVTNGFKKSLPAAPHVPLFQEIDIKMTKIPFPLGKYRKSTNSVCENIMHFNKYYVNTAYCIQCT